MYNPLIANVFYLSEDIEKRGFGLRRIYEECHSEGIKVNFNVMNYGFSVVFYRSKSEVNPKSRMLTQILLLDETGY